jgi:hypothetical protein
VSGALTTMQAIFIITITIVGVIIVAAAVAIGNRGI